MDFNNPLLEGPGRRIASVTDGPAALHRYAFATQGDVLLNRLSTT
jgi:hypothetical protein